MSANGTGKERLVRKAAIWHDFSAHGRRIVFTSNRDQQGEIYVMKADGSGQKRLTRRAGDDWARGPLRTGSGSRSRSCAGRSGP